MTERWLAADHRFPPRVDVIPGVHMRPIRADDAAIDYPAVMGSRETLWARYGQVWGWPPAHMTYEQDRDDLARHEREMVERRSFNYAVLDEAETELLGCVYLDPPEAGDDADVLVSWWVVDARRDSELAHALDGLVPRWVTEQWPFSRPRFAP